MTKQEYFEFANTFFNTCIEISKKKNADYTGGNDNPFSNFTSVENLGIKTRVSYAYDGQDGKNRLLCKQR
jgi:hypothetical protein